MLKFLTAGESHGKGCTVIIDGLPANIPISIEKINFELQKRRFDFGRGGRGLIEGDKAEILSGISFNKTIGSPLTLYIENKDFKNWEKKSRAEIQVTNPRPGHADLSGALKYGFSDVRPVLERASARETVSRVAAGAVFKQFLKHLQIDIASHTIQIGNIKIKKSYNFQEIKTVFCKDPEIRCIDSQTSLQMKHTIQEVSIAKDTLGGVIEIWAVNVPPGLGSYVQFDRKIDGQIAGALTSIPSVKAVEIGDGITAVSAKGSAFHDEIFFNKEQGFFRKSDHAGGIEGGITNGMPIIIRVFHKPISTLYQPLDTVNIQTKKKAKAQIERSDICVVPRAGVIAESMLAFVISKNLLEKFGSDNLEDIIVNYQNYLKRIHWKPKLI